MKNEHWIILLLASMLVCLLAHTILSAFGIREILSILQFMPVD